MSVTDGQGRKRRYKGRKRIYWHRGADVYPDGSFEQWTEQHAGYMEDVDDHLNSRDEPWDGHSQGHCGEHISIFGGDREAVEEAFQRHLAMVRARQNGTCQSRFGHQGDIDGITVYAVGMGTIRRAGSDQNEKLACIYHFDHDWGEWSEWREVGPGSLNRQRICQRCLQLEIRGRFSLPAVAAP